jgi:hypothetical protein
MASMGTEQGSELVEFHRSGGFTGEIDALMIQEDGQSTATTKQGEESFELDQVTLTDLREKLEQAHLGDVPAPHDTGVRDGFSYSIRFGGSEAKFMDGGIPDDVKPALSALGAILRDHGGS